MKVAIIIQGRAINFDEIVNSFSECEHKVLFCGWVGDVLKKTNNIDVLLLDKPTQILPNYCNYQSKGVLLGIEYLKKQGYTHFLKLRWDMIPNKNDVNKLLNLFITKYKKNKKPIFYSVSLNEVSMIQDWLLFGDEFDHLHYWGINNNIDNSICAEHTFFLNMVKSKNIPIGIEDLPNIKLLTKYFDFICKEIIDNNININIFVGNEKYKKFVDIKHYGTIDKTHIINY